MRKLFTTTAILMLTATGALAATTITGSYTAVYTPTVGNAPAITYDLNHTSFSESLTAGGMTSSQMDFITIAPGNNCGACGPSNTATGTVTVNFTLSDGTGGTGAGSDTGAYSATYTHNHQSDFITWNNPDPIVVNFTDGSVLDINLISTSDWDLVPDISFKLKNGPTTVPEPSSIALVGAGLLGLGFVVARNRRKILKTAI